MRFKLDENLGTRTKSKFVSAGHDVHTVRDEHPEGCSDATLYDVCCREKRCLITLDLDFADTFRFPPERSAGIVVLRFPENPNAELLDRSAHRLLQSMERNPIDRKLWVVDTARIRIHLPRE